MTDYDEMTDWQKEIVVNVMCNMKITEILPEKILFGINDFPIPFKIFLDELEKEFNKRVIEVSRELLKEWISRLKQELNDL